ncbi:GDSL-type esterase/lipase family protein [Nibricoccus aquaticus]|uniref:GDSL-type esterase/lipase family protein n=1 Tax=Nibricoccus aquaticus TaxID=2576891 RepID=UPI0015862808|nr:GDSL-type esterase/lipase family protein [Nibricoccus aquaticus]
MQELKAGDVVLIQFGHNDSGAVFTGKARASLPGLGEETQEGRLPDGKVETARTFGWYMRKMIGDVKAKGARPVLLSLTIRQRWENGKVERASGKYSQWTAELAKSEGAAFIDLSTMIADRYDELGEEKVKAFFPKDYVHTGPEGAELSASLVVAGLKGLPTNPFGTVEPYSEKGHAVEASPLTVLDAPKPAARAARERKPLPVPANVALPSLFLIGDSTVRNGQGDGANGQWGWGEPVVAYFDATKINVVNRAVGGLSSRTYLTGGHWEKVLGMIKPGDFVIMQFGHNDSSAVNDNTRARGTIKGTGEETEEIDNALTKQREVVHTYGWYLRKFIAEARANGATAIVCSPVPRKKWSESEAGLKTVVRGTGSYATWAEVVATETGVAFVPLNEIIARRYDSLGVEAVNGLFGDEHTHTNRLGAELNAGCVIAGLKALNENPLAAFLSVEAAKVESFVP